MLQAKQLQFERNGRELFTGVSFKLSAGEALQIIGANGSGKTTLLRLVCGLLWPTAGEILWQGRTINICRAEFLSQLQFLGHHSGLKNGLTVRENLQLAQALAPVANTTMTFAEALHQVGLTQYIDTLAGELSAGQQRRILFAKLLLLKTTIWVLDEPFAALDQAGFAFVEQLIAVHVSHGGLVLLTSHQEFNLQGLPHRTLRLVPV